MWLLVCPRGSANVAWSASPCSGLCQVDVLCVVASGWRWSKDGWNSSEWMLGFKCNQLHPCVSCEEFIVQCRPEADRVGSQLICNGH